MNEDTNTPRREVGWGDLKVGDVWISNPPENNTRTVTAVSAGPGANTSITFDDGKPELNANTLRVTIVEK
ncbi:hypothetical protein ACFORO_25985 [Amycolatopsis halotolerans]|uniref:Hypervirulence associated protein TUDOR domain-containing protein n=1 Tax=Amycolatopsis halotolerans TaxID=330083 RepID=A0ABV7QK06_9PSEU